MKNPLLLLTSLILTIATPSLATPPALLVEQTEVSIRHVLATELPALKLSTVELISEGWDNLVADVNGVWIFRFPRTGTYLDTMAREQALLGHLHGKIAMPIPYYEFIGNHTAFVGYRKILGDTLHGYYYRSLPDAVRNEIAEDLALFLVQLHNAVSVEEALAWGYEEYSPPVDWIEGELLGTLSEPQLERLVAEAIGMALSRPKCYQRPVFAHNDLHGGNFAFDEEAQRVTGVFDFSDAVIGDYPIEFSKLFCVDEDLAIRTCEIYASLQQVENPLVPAAVDYILRRCNYILCCRERGDHIREAQLIQMLDDFVPVWDSLTK